MNNEFKKLEKLAKIVILYLVTASLASLLIGYYLLNSDKTMLSLISISLIGFCGSSVAALTSCLDRYANGFELENGEKYPEGAERKETFNKRMSRWFFIRPFLGAVVAPVFVLGIGYFIDNAEQYSSSKNGILLMAFMGGLLAKSVIDLIKGLFKNIFKS